jgi:hypothetical protein
LVLGIGIGHFEWPRCAKRFLNLLSVGYVDEAKVNVLGQAGCQVGARGGAYIQYSDLLRVLSAFHKMADDPATKKASLQ